LTYTQYGLHGWVQNVQIVSDGISSSIETVSPWARKVQTPENEVHKCQYNKINFTLNILTLKYTVQRTCTVADSLTFLHVL